MKTSGLILVAFSALPLLGASSPAARKPTDPRSIVSPANPDARAVPVDDLYYTRRVAGAAWSPDGKSVLFGMDMTGRFNLWRVPAEGGWPVQLTQSDDAQFGAAYSPDGKWVAFQQDHAGDELHDVYAVPAAGGETVNLTRTPDVREVGPRFAPDGRSLVLMVKAKEAAVLDLALLDWTTRQVRRLTAEKDPSRNWSSVAFTPDGRTLFANRSLVDGSDSDVYSLDVATGRAENLTPHEGRAAYAASAAFPDGRTLLIQSTARNGYQNVALLDATTKKLTWVTDTEWEASAGDTSPDGKSFTYLVNEDGRIDAYLASRATLAAEKLPLEPGLNYFPGNPTSFSPAGDRLLVSHESSRTPADLWVYDIGSRRSKQLTVSTVASLDPQAIPPSQVVHYAGSDGKVISAFLWIPFNLERDASAPAIVLPHGGPTGQVVDYFNTDVAALVSRGYACIAPNVRGSTGYGLDFQRANYQDLGGMDLEDEVKGADFLVATGYVDPKRIGMFGGSYGGFMTLMALGKTPERWAAGVELYGIINWFTMLKHSDPLLNQYLRSLLGDPEKDRLIWEKASPIGHIHQLRAPLLVLQGDNDIRVPKEEAEQVVELLKKDGRVVEAHYYPNEGHGFLKRENQIDSIRRTIDWFERYLKPGTAKSAP